MVAHHSVLIFDVLGVSERASKRTTQPPVDREDDPKVLRDLEGGLGPGGLPEEPAGEPITTPCS